MSTLQNLRSTLLEAIECVDTMSIACPTYSHTLTPEQFGAVGDGVTDDYEALKSLATATVDGCTVNFRADANYCIDRIKDIGNRRVKVTPFGINDVDDIIYHANNIKLNLNGAKITHKRVDRFDDNGNLPYSGIASVTPFFFDRCTNVELVGPGTICGPAGVSTLEDGVGAGPNHGIVVFGGCNINIRNVTSTQWQSDGLWIGGYQDQFGPATGVRETAKNVTTYDCTFNNNARLGVAVVGCQNYVDYRSHMSYSGNTSYGWHSPACGVDVEPLPFNNLTTSATFNQTKFVDNCGCVAAVNDQNIVVNEVVFNQINAVKSIGSPSCRVVDHYLVANSDISVNGGSFLNTGVRATDGRIEIKDANFDMNNGENILFLIGSSISSLINNDISYDGPAASTARAIDQRNATSTFDNNRISATFGPHDQNGSDLLATLINANGNTWNAPLGSLTWDVVYSGTSSNETYNGNVA